MVTYGWTEMATPQTPGKSIVSLFPSLVTGMLLFSCHVDSNWIKERTEISDFVDIIDWILDYFTNTFTFIQKKSFIWIL